MQRYMLYKIKKQPYRELIIQGLVVQSITRVIQQLLQNGCNQMVFGLTQLQIHKIYQKCRLKNILGGDMVIQVVSKIFIFLRHQLMKVIIAQWMPIDTIR